METRGISQGDLAARVGKTQSLVSKWLRREVAMTLAQVDQVAEILQLPVEELIREED